MVMVLSVGGGSDRTSANIKRGVEYAKFVGAMVVGIVGPHGGYTKERATICLCVPAEDPNLITSLTHSIQALVLHLLFNHPRLCLT
jgi:phosphoheptose isomerase